MQSGEKKVDSAEGIIADLHVHSKYSRATSRDISLSSLVKYARMKGLDLLGTGDFTHPSWFAELKKMQEQEGILYYDNFPFLLSTEISLIYTQEKQRRVHLVILSPSLEVTEQINSWLGKKGRLDYDGRPIFGMSCVELLDGLISIDTSIEVIPAHAWTPWYGIFGSMSGFSSLKEAFQDKVDKIHAIETGMSSDPAMNWRISELNSKAIISFSDAHSAWPFRIGREATIFNLKKGITYKEVIKEIRNNEINGTVEVSPLYGKYHWDGHRNCDFSCSPKESLKLNNICPVCRKPLTIGVEHRVEEIAEKPEGYRPKNAKPFYTLLPLHELIANVKASTLTSQKVWQEYNKLISAFSSEFNILLKVKKEKLVRVVDERLVKLIMLNREGKIKVKPGFDGKYGETIVQEKQAKLI
jgi:uncharacterized protein (TIGR00375 family)